MAKIPKRPPARKPVAKGRKGRGVVQMRRVLLRLPDDIGTWLDDTSAELGISRDAFMRQLLVGVRASFKAAEVAGSPESRLFRQLESRLLDATERATTEAVERVLRSSGGIVPGGGKGDR